MVCVYVYGDVKMFEVYVEVVCFGEVLMFVVDARASRGFGVGGAARTLCDAYGAARVVMCVVILDV